MTAEMLHYEWKMLFSIIIAVILGFAIGFERKYRAKEAGMRTHTIVCAGSALLMSLSKYAFLDVAAYDAARIAAQIVSGIGFLGAGIIVYRKNQIRGLTTAAGIWATAGVGMAAGARMYLVAVGTTVTLILVQCFLHLDLNLFRSRRSYHFRINFTDDGTLTELKNLFSTEHFHSLIMKRTPDGITYQASVFTEKEISSEQMKSILHENPYILSIERCDEE